MNEQQAEQMRHGAGFIAALDQSGGSTPKALAAYGVGPERYASEAEMFDLVHAMRTRVITSPSFTSKRIIGAILFERTMDGSVQGRPTAEYLWEIKRVVPFLKVDKGLAEEDRHVRIMNPIPGLDELLERAVRAGIFGTKMRSVIHAANARGIAAALDQQFAVGQQILKAGLVPILEPEVSIKAADKPQAESLLKAGFIERLDALPGDQKVMLKLTLPSVAGAYGDLVKHPRVLRVVALSGGYSRDESNALLAQNPGVIASFSRALTEGLTAQQSDAEFNAALDKAIESIYQASIA